jgi:long-chain acyl-CoA synthetase
MTQASATIEPPRPAVPLAAAHAALTAPGKPFEMEEVLIRGVPTRVWKLAPPTLREVFQHGRATHGPKTFLVYEDDRATFSGFALAALAIADELMRQGLRKGDRVAIAMRNLPEWPAAFFGTVLAGGIATALNAWWTGPELEYGLTDSGARFAIVDAERLERIAAHLENCPALQRIYVVRGSAPAAGVRFAQLEEVTGAVNDWSKLPDRPLPDVVLEPDDDATIMYTSGTTGNPKGALGTHRNATTCVVASTFAAPRRFIRRGETPPAPDPSAPQRTTLLAVPFFHTTGLHAVMCSAVQNGTKLVLMRRWDAEQAMALIERERCTSAGGVPTIAWQLVEHPARAKYDLSSLEVISYGGAPAVSDLVRRIKSVFPNATPGCGWGMTETSATFTTFLGEDYEARPESSGPALPVCDMKIMGERGERLPVGQVGELWVKGPNIVQGYWNKPQATAEVFVDGWLKTGDLARLDEEGFLYVVDRKKDMLIRGGENIYCIEVEDALCKHPAVVDAGVIGLPHRTLGEEPGAVVTLKPDARASEEELKAFVASRLAAFKVPVRIVFRSDVLPRNANGKIMKSELKKLFGEATA